MSPFSIIQSSFSLFFHFFSPFFIEVVEKEKGEYDDTHTAIVAIWVVWRITGLADLRARIWVEHNYETCRVLNFEHFLSIIYINKILNNILNQFLKNFAHFFSFFCESLIAQYNKQSMKSPSLYLKIGQSRFKWVPNFVLLRQG